MEKTIYDFEVKTIDGKPMKMSDYQNKVLLIVNVASQCGFTSQYDGLQKMYEQFKEKGFVVLGFPCNQFGGQEPGSSEEIKIFCQGKYDVSFPLFEKIEVNGSGTHPLYQYLKSEAKGALGTESIKWNFTKFLINRQGKVVERFGSVTKPEEITKSVEALL